MSDTPKVPDVVISLSLVDTGGEKARTLAAVSGVRSCGATCPHDMAENVERLASQAVGELFRRFRDCPPPNLEPDPETVGAQLDAISKTMAQWLRAKAAELVGKTLYHPEHTLRAWASDFDPQPPDGEPPAPAPAPPTEMDNFCAMLKRAGVGYKRREESGRDAGRSSVVVEFFRVEGFASGLFTFDASGRLIPTPYVEVE